MNALIAVGLLAGGSAWASQQFAGGRPTVNGHNPKDQPRGEHPDVAEVEWGVPPLHGMLPARNIREYIFTDNFARGRFAYTGKSIYNNGWTVTYDQVGPTGPQVFQQTDYHGTGQTEAIGGA
jgi:hypothetical protein